VFAGYPADIAGLQVGDVILLASDKEIIGPPGTLLRLMILRNGVTFAIIIIRGKVCYKDS
jgi:C-terminal processing protease CtpA/Prc